MLIFKNIDVKNIKWFNQALKILKDWMKRITGLIEECIVMGRQKGYSDLFYSRVIILLRIA